VSQQLDMEAFGGPSGELTDAEREVWEAVDCGDYGVREYARETDRSPGTLSNLLRRARENRGEES
jgi:DNA-directed RNA polymerase specialized sigma24 family protein